MDVLPNHQLPTSIIVTRHCLVDPLSMGNLTRLVCRFRGSTGLNLFHSNHAFPFRLILHRMSEGRRQKTTYDGFGCSCAAQAKRRKWVCSAKPYRFLVQYTYHHLQTVRSLGFCNCRLCLGRNGGAPRVITLRQYFDHYINESRRLQEDERYSARQKVVERI
jgi:hypothetical protein